MPHTPQPFIRSPLPLVASRLRNSTEAGFTLIELLISIVIMGILASIAVPSFVEETNRIHREQVETDVYVTTNRVIERLTMKHDKNQNIAVMSAIRIAESDENTTVTLHGKPNAWWAVKGVNPKVEGACFIYYSYTHELTTCAETEAPLLY